MLLPSLNMPLAFGGVIYTMAYFGGPKHLRQLLVPVALHPGRGSLSAALLYGSSATGGQKGLSGSYVCQFIRPEIQTLSSPEHFM